MRMDIAAIRLSLLMLPGIIGLKVYKKLVGRYPHREWEELTEILIFSVFSYSFLNLIISSLGSYVPFVKTRESYDFNNLLNEIFTKNELNFNLVIVIYASGISAILAYIFAFISQKNIINLIGQKLKVTRRDGDIDLWDKFHNTYNEWVYIRDHKLNLTYFGHIDRFSDLGSKKQLILTQVSVYNIDSEYLYDADVVYLCRDDDDLSIEINAYERESILGSNCEEVENNGQNQWEDR
ncbi:hypothetical protein Gferi_19465 [Geosporobacter ferrireducens]|uniref:Uncharacterized protein n=2 Tax=Geosporobacter ferrireducens TaxID=1424294 RepID=A0A1D8GKS6_9FIRM|nr:hypothetical protein Gferi_19465 [Geosporobacter ferrireducens]